MLGRDQSVPLLCSLPKGRVGIGRQSRCSSASERPWPPVQLGETSAPALYRSARTCIQIRKATCILCSENDLTIFVRELAQAERTIVSPRSRETRRQQSFPRSQPGIPHRRRFAAPSQPPCRSEEGRVGKECRS